MDNAIRRILFDALNSTGTKCDGCDQVVASATRYAWEFSVCESCLVQCRAGRMSFRTEELMPYDADGNSPQGCKSCGRPMALSRFRSIDGVETCIFRRWETCGPCME